MAFLWTSMLALVVTLDRALHVGAGMKTPILLAVIAGSMAWSGGVARADDHPTAQPRAHLSPAARAARQRFAQNYKVALGALRTNSPYRILDLDAHGATHVAKASNLLGRVDPQGAREDAARAGIKWTDKTAEVFGLAGPRVRQALTNVGSGAPLESPVRSESVKLPPGARLDQPQKALLSTALDELRQMDELDNRLAANLRAQGRWQSWGKNREINSNLMSMSSGYAQRARRALEQLPRQNPLVQAALTRLENR